MRPKEQKKTKDLQVGKWEKSAKWCNNLSRWKKKPLQAPSTSTTICRLPASEIVRYFPGTPFWPPGEPNNAFIWKNAWFENVRSRLKMASQKKKRVLLSARFCRFCHDVFSRFFLLTSCNFSIKVNHAFLSTHYDDDTHKKLWKLHTRPITFLWCRSGKSSICSTTIEKGKKVWKIGGKVSSFLRAKFQVCRNKGWDLTNSQLSSFWRQDLYLLINRLFSQ